MFGLIKKVLRPWTSDEKPGPDFSADVVTDDSGLVKITVTELATGADKTFELSWQELSACVEASLAHRELTSWMCVSPEFAESLAAYLYERDSTEAVQ
jgi:hypothetical protein